MRITSILFIAISFCVSNVAQSQIKLSLKEAKEMALKNSYSVKDKELELEKAKKTIQETAALGLPQINAKAEHNYNAQIPQTPLPASFITGNPADEGFILVEFGVPHQSSYGITASQLIFDGSYIVALMASRVFKESARVDVEISKNETTELITQNYGSVLVTENLAKLLSENLAVLSSTFEENKALLREGFVEEQDVDQLQILVNNIKNNLENAERQAKIAKMVFNLQIGLPLDQEVFLTDALETVVAEVSSQLDLVQSPFKVEENINFRSLLLQEQGAKLQLRNQQMTYLPNVTGFISHSQNAFGQNFEMFNFNQFWVPVTVIGASVNWRLFTGLDRYAKTSKARIDLDRLQIAKSQTRSALTLEHASAKSDFEFALANYNNRLSNVASSKKIKDKTLIKYKEGLVGSLELTQVEDQLLKAQNEYSEALYLLIASRARLDRVIGIRP